MGMGKFSQNPRWMSYTADSKSHNQVTETSKTINSSQICTDYHTGWYICIFMNTIMGPVMMITYPACCVPVSLDKEVYRGYVGNTTFKLWGLKEVKDINVLKY